MKIIGKTNRGVIIEASNDEVANLVGYYSEYNAPSGGYNREKFNVGDEIKVAAMYQQLFRLSSLSSQADQAKKTLQAALELFSIVDPVVRAITDDPEASKEQNG